MQIKPPYKHLVQKPALCGPCCLQMILLRRGFDWLDQEEIAKKVGARILQSKAGSFIIKLKITKKRMGVGLYLREFRSKKIKDFLKKYQLKTEVFYIREITHTRKFIEENLAKGNDIMVNFWPQPFYKQSDVGHYALISAIKENKITLCDPYPLHKSFWDVSIDKLVQSMGKQFDGKERGFIVIKNKL